MVQTALSLPRCDALRMAYALRRLQALLPRTARVTPMAFRSRHYPTAAIPSGRRGHVDTIPAADATFLSLLARQPTTLSMALGECRRTVIRAIHRRERLNPPQRSGCKPCKSSHSAVNLMTSRKTSGTQDHRSELKVRFQGHTVHAALSPRRCHVGLHLSSQVRTAVS